MDQFVTTYRRDYLWPLSRPPPLVMGPTYGTRCVPVQCRCAPKPHTDHKLFPARVGAPPEVESSRYDQPNAFLLKVKHRHP
uniref:Uncharacterized protein n=1 Tax=Timema poppense TaxID=170557 RepID=A0A7R9D8R5_TIMPO|nr:unnamed protein product [Timema poppensis]